MLRKHRNRSSSRGLVNLLDPSHVLAISFHILYSFSQRRPPPTGKASGLTQPGSVAQNFRVGRVSAQSPQGPKLLPAHLRPSLVWDLDSWGCHILVLFPFKQCPQRPLQLLFTSSGQNWDTRSPSCKGAGMVGFSAGLVASQNKTRGT